MPNSDPAPVRCVVDSDIVIDYIRGLAYARELLDRWGRDGLVALSAVTHLEVYRGMKPGEEEVTSRVLGQLVAVSLDAPLAQMAGLLISEQRSKGFTLTIPDAVIAVTALTLEVPLLTNNVRHYPFPGLNVVKGAPA